MTSCKIMVNNGMRFLEVFHIECRLGVVFDEKKGNCGYGVCNRFCCFVCNNRVLCLTSIGIMDRMYTSQSKQLVIGTNENLSPIILWNETEKYT